MESPTSALKVKNVTLRITFFTFSLLPTSSSQKSIPQGKVPLRNKNVGAFVENNPSMVIKVLRVILPDAVDHRGHIRVGLRSLLIVVADHPDAVLLSAPINTAFAKIGESGVQHDANIRLTRPTAPSYTESR